MQLPAAIVAPLTCLLLQGCVASAALDLATMPVRAASQASDWATTSQDEADRSRGRDIRRREERMGELQRNYEDVSEDCLEGEDEACREAVALQREMDALRDSLPLEPEDD